MSLPEFKLQSYARMRLLLSLHAERPAAAVKYGISVTFPHQDDRGGVQADGLYRKNRIYCLTNAPAHQSTLMSFLISSGSVLVALSGAFRTDARLLNKKARRQHPRPPTYPERKGATPQARTALSLFSVNCPSAQYQAIDSSWALVLLSPCGNNQAA